MRIASCKAHRVHDETGKLTLPNPLIDPFLYVWFHAVEADCQKSPRLHALILVMGSRTLEFGPSNQWQWLQS